MAVFGRGGLGATGGNIVWGSASCFQAGSHELSNEEKFGAITPSGDTIVEVEASVFSNKNGQALREMLAILDIMIRGRGS